MACINSRPLLPVACARVATPGPAPLSSRAFTSLSCASHASSWSIFVIPSPFGKTLASTTVVATIAAMDMAVKPQGCTNLKLRQLMRRVAAHYDAEVGKTGLKGTQFSLLSYVVKLGPVRPADLAAEMRISPSTLTRNLKPLVDAGLVEVQPGA